jgi:hypothetical protein
MMSMSRADSPTIFACPVMPGLSNSAWLSIAVVTANVVGDVAEVPLDPAVALVVPSAAVATAVTSP